MMTTPQTTVRDIALDQPAAIRVFEKFGIDYCCGGRKPLTQACEERSLDPQAVLAAIESASGTPVSGPTNWATAPLADLCTHIVETHHAYVRAELPRLQQLAQKVVSRHGNMRHELPRIQQLIDSLTKDLLDHLAKEEAVLFPWITNFEQTPQNCGPRSLGCGGAVSNPIRVMLAEHDAAGAVLAGIRDLSHDFTPPEGACPTYRGFYQALAEFEKDLHQHIHLENNILFPRAIEMDESCAWPDASELA
ncbi:MAG TPA: iron-sulfur cluster repair di-iron protein [Acidobacteriaceae bacterium]|jgi:regulator of cell morphogenesis and NO signaling